jgi:murein L,D-transpeptidase YafK
MKNTIKYIILLVLIGLITFYFWPEKKLDSSKKIDRILVIKHERKMIVYSNNEELKTYKISLGKHPEGKKEFEGDQKTPEGLYTINDKNPNSEFHLNLGISYPNEEDIKDAERLNKKPGGLIKIHGLKNGLGFIGKFHRLSDWTLGCIAVTNSEIEELYENVPIGTVIEIRK